MKPEKALHSDTLAVHAGKRDGPGVRPVAEPIVLSSTYARDESGNLPEGYMYSRIGNPNRVSLEECLATLEGGTACAAFSSGSAAAMAVFQSLAPGDHIVVSRDSYYGTLKVAQEVIGRWGLNVTLADTSDIGAIENAILGNTRLLWVETPTNPLIRVSDIAAMAKIAKRAGAVLAVDNTFATPMLQQPLALGADLVMHSTSKYIGGHSDVVGGAVIARDGDGPTFSAIRKCQVAGGAVPSPFDCWLALRGVRTLAVRLRAQCESAQRVAEALAAHGEVHAVHYPGLGTHPGFEIAQRQMKLPGAMLSFQVKGGRERALKVAGLAKIFTRATSLGGVESLIEHRASVEQGTSTPDDLLRLSIGLEHSDDIIADLKQALENSGS